MWAWVKKLQSFFNQVTGRVMNRRSLHSVAEAAQVVNSRSVSALTQGMIGQGLTVQEWYQGMRGLIKSAYIEQYLLAKGGRQNMRTRDFKSIGGMLTDQYKYLKRFAAEIAAGNLTPGEISNRAAMYVNSSREAFERAHLRSVLETIPDERLEVFWELGMAEHCTDCVGFYALGWQKWVTDPYRGAFPGNGWTVCLTGCKCHLRYRDRETGKEL